VAASRDAGRFEGMPSPAAAGLGGLGLRRVSQVAYRSFEVLDLRHSHGTFMTVVFAQARRVQEPSITFFAVAIGYALPRPAEWPSRRGRRRPLPAPGETAQG